MYTPVSVSEAKQVSEAGVLISFLKWIFQIFPKFFIGASTFHVMASSNMPSGQQYFCATCFYKSIERLSKGTEGTPRLSHILSTQNSSKAIKICSSVLYNTLSLYFCNSSMYFSPRILRGIFLCLMYPIVIVSCVLRGIAAYSSPFNSSQIIPEHKV